MDNYETLLRAGPWLSQRLHRTNRLGHCSLCGPPPVDASELHVTSDLSSGACSAARPRRIFWMNSPVIGSSFIMFINLDSASASSRSVISEINAFAFTDSLLMTYFSNSSMSLSVSSGETV